MGDPVVVLVSGRRFAGKDTVGALLREALGSDCALAHFADEVRRCYAEISGADYDRLCDDREYKELHRPALIRVAMEERDTFGDDVWAQYTDERHRRQCRIMLVCDHRFVSERSYFMTRQRVARVVTVGVRASDETRTRRGWVFTAGVDDHRSETELDGHTNHFEIANDSESRDELRARLRCVVDRVRSLA